MAGGPLVRAGRWDSVLLLQNLERPEAVKTCGRKKRIVMKIQTMKLAERVGFEPTVEFPRHSLSRRAPSTARTPLRGCDAILADASRWSNEGRRLNVRSVINFQKIKNGRKFLVQSFSQSLANPV